ncbi:MAG: dTDP-4-dehydrorhamnose 3,5-epimerase [Bacteroidales bacterium]|jgi:dTDP-4-dehydrorhamnose 3,5-epimerase|nr:dTDP-4-dehydrorhamnose 3,5-epimerase [Bacteroidales bacterium]
MNIQKTPIDGLLILTPRVFGDARGYFLESYNAERYREAGITADFVQDNESRSTRGVVRGLHFQLPPHAQAKLVRVIEGVVFDVAVDLRRTSPTYGQWFGIELSGDNKKQFFIPRGFAHGFSVLSDTALFAYKCDNFYHPESESGIIYNDPAVGIDWRIPPCEALISDKDLTLKTFNEAVFNF